MQEITQKYARQVMDDHQDLFFRHPDVDSFGVEFFPGETEADGTWGILLSAPQRTDQSLLPAEDRIPDCLDGIPIRWEMVDGWSIPAGGGE